jgi:hypothetical protein
MSYGNERKKQIGTFYHERGTVMVNVVYEERSVYVGSSNQKFVFPVAFELMVNNMEFRIKAEDLRGFIAVICGNAEEFHRSRDIAMRRMEKLGVDIGELP